MDEVAKKQEHDLNQLEKYIHENISHGKIKDTVLATTAKLRHELKDSTQAILHPNKMHAAVTTVTTTATRTTTTAPNCTTTVSDILPKVGGADVGCRLADPALVNRNDPYPGMEVGPDHPIFGSNVGNTTPQTFPTSRTLPPPPGARFDPFGPPTGPMMPGMTGTRGRGAFPGPGIGPFSGPNPDHLRMPPDSFDQGPMGSSFGNTGNNNTRGPFM